MDWLDLLAVQGTLKSLLPTPQFKSIDSSALSFLYSPTVTSIHDYWKNHSLHYQFSSVQSLSLFPLFATPRTAVHQASLSITNSWSSLKLMSIYSVMPSSHLILCRPLLLPPTPPSIRVFSNEYDQPRQHIKKQRHYFTDKCPSDQSYDFSSSHVWMRELDYKEES